LKDNKYDDFNNALVLNNHFDTDGVLSTWTCLFPDEALKYSSLLIEGAEAGDFGEWSSDNGVKLDLTISSFLKDTDEDTAYHQALDELPFILSDFKKSGGKEYENIWKEEWQDLTDGWKNIKNGLIYFTTGQGNTALIQGGLELHNLPCYAIYRGLKESNLLNKTTRILCAISSDSGWSYRYELPGHGWVKKLVKRNAIPEPDRRLIVDKLNELDSIWFVGTDLTSICHSDEGVHDDPEAIIKYISEVDKEA